MAKPKNNKYTVLKYVISSEEKFYVYAYDKIH